MGSKEIMERYYRSDDWHTLKNDVIDCAGERCENCGKQTKKLDVHHLTYDNFGDEKREDLMALCLKCHMDVHNGVTVRRNHSDSVLEYSMRSWELALRYSSSDEVEEIEKDFNDKVDNDVFSEVEENRIRDAISESQQLLIEIEKDERERKNLFRMLYILFGISVVCWIVLLCMYNGIKNSGGYSLAGVFLVVSVVLGICIYKLHQE